MNPNEDFKMPEGGDDLLAAEYVLGVLDADARAVATMRVENDKAFATLVDTWSVRFEPLNDEYALLPLPAIVKSALDKRLFGEAEKSGLLSSLAFWRGLAAGAFAAMLFAIFPRFMDLPSSKIDAAPIVASMQADGGELRFVALYQPGDDEIRISRVKADKAEGRDFELWLIEEGVAPLSLGVVPATGQARIKVTAAHAQKITAGDVFAISDEPAGGSPSGAPTGPIVAAGPSQSI